MNPATLTSSALIDLYRAYPARHPDRGYLISEMRKRGILEPIAKDNPNHIESGPGGGQFTSSGGGGGGSSGSSSSSLPASAVVAPPNAYSPTGPIVNYSISPKGKKSTVTPKPQIPPTYKAPGQIPIHGLKSPTVHITKPKTVMPIKPKLREVKEPKPKPGKSVGSTKIKLK